MSRPAKPYLHRGWWVTNIGGTRKKLCRVEAGADAADDAFHNLKIERRENGIRTFPKLRVVELVALFLDTVKIEKSSDTYLDHRRWLTEFGKRFGSLLVSQWIKEGLSPPRESGYTLGNLPTHWR